MIGTTFTRTNRTAKEILLDEIFDYEIYTRNIKKKNIFVPTSDKIQGYYSIYVDRYSHMIVTISVKTIEIKARLF